MDHIWLSPENFSPAATQDQKKKGSESRLKALFQIGIKHVISLMEPEEYNTKIIRRRQGHLT